LSTRSEAVGVLYSLNQIATHSLGQEVYETYGWINREKGCHVPVVVVGPTRLTASGAIMTRIAPCVIAALTLGLSACANPYDPVERGFGGGLWGAASVLPSEQRRVAGQERPLERRSEGQLG
jgi:hypothetical protein